MKYYRYENGTEKEISREEARQKFTRFSNREFEILENEMQQLISKMDTDDIQYWFCIGFQR